MEMVHKSHDLRTVTVLKFQVTISSVSRERKQFPHAELVRVPFSNICFVSCGMNETHCITKHKKI